MTVWIDVTDIMRGSDEDHMRGLADIHKSQIENERRSKP